MFTKKLYSLLLLLLVCSVNTYGQNTPQLSPAKEINLLIAQVKNSGCIFHRNGKTHASEAAAGHLELKLSRGARHAKTTESFIARLASKSSFSGKPYHIECQSDELILMAQWLNTELLVIRNSSKS